MFTLSILFYEDVVQIIEIFVQTIGEEAIMSVLIKM